MRGKSFPFCLGEKHRALYGRSLWTRKRQLFRANQSTLSACLGSPSPLPGRTPMRCFEREGFNGFAG